VNPRLLAVLGMAYVAASTGLAGLSGCSAERPNAAQAAQGDVAPNVPAASCADGRPGCPCTTPHQRVECGSVREIVGDQAVCTMGHSECSADGRWGACAGDVVQVRTVSTIGLQGLGAAGPCVDPCNPYCSTFVDNPGGLSLDGGLSAVDGGLTIVPQPPPPNTCTGLSISPSTAPATDLVITSTTTPATKTFTSALVPSGCNPSAPAPLWYTDKFDVAQMSATGTLSAIVPIAGSVNVSASLGSFTATVAARIVVSVDENGTTNPPPGGASFATFPAETGSSPTDTNLELLYPYSDTMFPLGLQAPLVQWSNGGVAASGGVVVTLQYPPTGTPLFRVSQLVTESMTAPVPLRAAAPRHIIAQPVWLAFEQTVHRNRGTYGDAGRISVRRRVGSTTYASKSSDVRFAPGQLKGRIYYNSYGTALVSNYSGAKQSTGGAFTGGSFGAATLVIPPGAAAPTVAAGFNGTSGCYVCHSADPNGTTLITGNKSHVATRYTLPGSAPNGGTSYGTTKLLFPAISPSSTRLFSNSNAIEGDTSSRLYTLAGANVASNVPSGLQAGMPSFSPDGSQVTFIHRGGTVPTPLATSSTAADGKSVAVMSFNGDAVFSSFKKLATPTSGLAAWPAFLPAGQDGVVYQVETRTTPNGGFGYTRHDCECSTYKGALGELWWVNSTGTSTASRLDRANGYTSGGANALPSSPSSGHAVVGGTAGPGGSEFVEQSYNYEPTVLPQLIGGYSWVIFTSRRMYGNVATINPYASDPRFDNISIDPTPKKLWIAAVSGAPTPGTDPSYPAFYLPGQELIAGNSKGVFALDACRAPSATLSTANECDTDFDCCGAPATAACVLDPPPLASPPSKHCVNLAAGTCRNIGESCVSTSNCCNAAAGGVCAAGVCTNPPAYYSAQTYQRDFTASCLPGYTHSWTTFEWRSQTPGGSRIELSAQIGDGIGGWVPATSVPFATAAGADVLAPSWATNGTKLGALLPQTRVAALRVTMRFIPSSDNSQAPTLLDWRQSFDCIPSE
jgi:hypothetical protein